MRFGMSDGETSKLAWSSNSFYYMQLDINTSSMKALQLLIFWPIYQLNTKPRPG